MWGKRAVVPERFKVDLTTHRLVARAYDDGVAFRYELPAGFAGTNEQTAFNFAGDYTAWFYDGEQHNLGPEKLSQVAGRRQPVMTVKVDDAATWPSTRRTWPPANRSCWSRAEARRPSAWLRLPAQPGA